VKARKHKKAPPVHPGEMLLDDFLKPEGNTLYALAKAIAVPAPRMYDLCKGKHSVTADSALRLSKAFGNSAQFWLNLQTSYDLEIARDAAGGEIDATVTALPSFDASARA